MFKVRKKYIGVLIEKNNRQYTLYNTLPQKQLQILNKILGNKFVYFSKPKKVEDDKNN